MNHRRLLSPPQFMPTIRILEQPTSDILLISWREPGRCCYSEQRWVRRKARERGVCALSGAMVRAGDTVYAPTGKPEPQNHDQVILNRSLRATVTNVA